jgi:hypothetical protein
MERKHLVHSQSTPAEVEAAKLKGQHYCSIFWWIPFERTVVDVLHCFLRGYDKLFNILLDDVEREFGNKKKQGIQNIVSNAGLLSLHSTLQFSVGFLVR